MSFARAITNVMRPQASASRAFSTSSTRLDMSRIQLIGRLVADPEVRTTRAGKDYIRYAVATTDPLGPPAEDGERPPPTTSFHNIFAFGEGPVSRLTNIKKGTLVYVEADFKVQRNPTESADGIASTNILVQHRSMNVISRPKTPEA